jgi:hypothetical protein
MLIGTSVTAPGGTFSAAVHIDGTDQPLYRRRTDGKVFVAGIIGERYTLHVTNLSAHRIEVVGSVDQRDTLTDSPADLGNRGMIVPAYGSTSFDGWRLNDSEVGAFVFGDPDRSVSAQATGDRSGVGVIGFAAFTEQRHVQPEYPVYRGFTPHGAPATKGAPVGFGAERGGVGTGIGATVGSRVGRVGFVRSTGPATILEIGYDTVDWLTEAGIIGPAEPSAFPKTDAFGAYQRIDG